MELWSAWWLPGSYYTYKVQSTYIHSMYILSVRTYIGTCVFPVVAPPKFSNTSRRRPASYPARYIVHRDLSMYVPSTSRACPYICTVCILPASVLSRWAGSCEGGAKGAIAHAWTVVGPGPAHPGRPHPRLSLRQLVPAPLSLSVSLSLLPSRTLSSSHVIVRMQVHAPLQTKHRIVSLSALLPCCLPA